MKYNKKLIAVLLAVLLILTLTVVWLGWGNRSIAVTELDVRSDKLPDPFSGYRIAHVSDLHNEEFGKGNEKLLSILEDAEPDMIAVTGDIVDSRRTDADIAIDFMKKAVKIAPCYYVTGNHENRLPDIKDELLAEFRDVGVTVLENTATVIESDGESIWIAGAFDVSYDDPALEGILASALEDTDGYTVLLSHRPDNMEKYKSSGADLVLCGHAHGGQFILPFMGGVYAPGQGLFPKYYEGMYAEGDTAMIVSRGLGNSIFPLRINNRPQVILVELWDEE